MPDAAEHLHIVGPGRAGLALGAALWEVGAVRHLSFTGRAARAPDHPLFHGTPPAAEYRVAEGLPSQPPPSLVILAVPDDSVVRVAEWLCAAQLSPTIPVLHLSGAFGSELLSSLAARGNATGSLHPLVALADGTAAERLRGAWFSVEGAPAARAVAEGLVDALGGRVLHVEAHGKPLYHAAAVAASNFVVALMAVGERWMTLAGVPLQEARPALAALAAGAVDSVARRGPAEALTGPIERGDVETVGAHLARLSRPDRDVYSVLAASTLTLARQRGLDPEKEAELVRLLESTE